MKQAVGTGASVDKKRNFINVAQVNKLIVQWKSYFIIAISVKKSLMINLDSILTKKHFPSNQNKLYK